jgi:pyridoxal phosphate enzyme (YggS family)
VESITVIAVSKGHAAEQVRAAADCGVRDFAESYLQEASRKIEALPDLTATWHFIGRVQANKTREIAERFDWVHGIDRMKIAERLSAQRPHYAPPLQVCLQVNIAAEIAKAGIEPAMTAQLAQSVSTLPRLQLRGLMCMLPADLSHEDNRRLFGAMRTLLERVNVSGGSLDTLSMGMSDDFSDAVLEGATLIRVGTAIFGPRTRRFNE